MRRSIEVISCYRGALRLQVNGKDMSFHGVLEIEDTGIDKKWVLVSPRASDFYADSDILSFLMEFSETEQRRILSMLNMEFQIS